jgi:pimeloyl-[acyl-carrier protein] methyl ester esterase
MTAHIHREIFGNGKPLVMLHGWAMHSGVWRRFAQQLGQHCQLICLDLPGHGRSDALMPFDLQHVAEALLEAVPVEEFSLLGWSLGATLALEMADRQPRRVSKLLLLAGNPHFVQTDNWPGMPAEILDRFAEMLVGDVQQTLARFLALQVNGLAHGKPMLLQLKTALQECPPPPVETLQAGLAMLKCCDLRDALAAVRQPLRVILGERDRLVPAALAWQLLQIKPDAELTVLARAGHAPFLSHADELVEIIRRFIA